MLSKKDEIRKGVALRLKELRDRLDCSPIEMATRLGISRGAYNKNEHGINFPCIDTQRRLAEGIGVSMDWLLFGKGPVFYKVKEKADELQERVGELEKRNEELEKKNTELEAELEKERQLNRDPEAEKQSVLADLKPEVSELLEHMVRIPLLYYEILTHYQRFRVENRELVEMSIESSK